MLGTLGIVQLYLAHLPAEQVRRTEQFLRRQLLGKTLLEWIVRRATEAQRLDGVIVLAGPGEAEARLAALVPADVPVYFSDAADPLAACVKALAQYRSGAVVLIETDAPFIDPALIDRLVTTGLAHDECDYISYRLSDGAPAELSKIGIFAEWCKADALRKADRKARAAADRAQPARFLYTHPELFRLRLLATPAALDRGDLRLRVNCEEDWDNAIAIAEALGPDALEWQRIAHLLDEQPALRERMAVLNQADQ
jgi:spore coat polysaccharide biosynthesis protein SpsF (cytidylyltransferase family)